MKRDERQLLWYPWLSRMTLRLTLWREFVIVSQVEWPLAHHDLVNDYSKAVHVAFLSAFGQLSLHPQQFRSCPKLFCKHQISCSKKSDRVERFNAVSLSFSMRSMIIVDINYKSKHRWDQKYLSRLKFLLYVRNYWYLFFLRVYETCDKMLFVQIVKLS